jgi:DNA topoisomerase IB
MIEFAASLPELRAQVAADLAQAGLSKSRVLALGVRLLDVGMFRIGGEEYAEEHETYGLATLEKRHVRIHDAAAFFDYSAKGGKRRQIVISDPDVVDILAELKARRGGGSCLLAWRDARRWVDVSSHDLNTYLSDCRDYFPSAIT